jgi:hypothetical protein
LAQQPANHVAAAERAARQGDLLGVHLLFPGALIDDRAEASPTARFRASYALVKMALSALGALGAPCFVLPAGGSATNVAGSFPPDTRHRARDIEHRPPWGNQFRIYPYWHNRVDYF